MHQSDRGQRTKESTWVSIYMQYAPYPTSRSFFFSPPNRSIPRGSCDLHPSLSSACIGIIIISNRCTLHLSGKRWTHYPPQSYSLVVMGPCGASPFYTISIFYHYIYKYIYVCMCTQYVKPKSINYQTYSNDTSRRINNAVLSLYIRFFFFVPFFILQI